MRFSCLALLLSLACGGSRVSGRPPREQAAEEAEAMARAMAQASNQSSHVFNHGPLLLEERVVGPGATDWIRGYSDSCETCQAGAVVHWEAAQGSLDVELFDPEGRPLVWGAPGEVVERRPGEARLLRPSHPGAFFVRIRVKEG
ncbi:MAG: hypothetical protein ABW123_15535, partial [Cystobacter sp.]